MTSKPVLMIHQITDEMFDLPLEDYILTFDDGTQDHYEYFEKIKVLDTDKIYFIITGNIGTEGYLSVDQLKEMSSDTRVTIGGHSHSHKRIEGMRLAEQIAHIKEDTKQMLDWFGATLDLKPTAFCFPYNYDPNGIYRSIVRNAGFTDFYSHERLAVESLILNTVLSASA